jgi:class 3 adenylate cyclase
VPTYPAEAVEMLPSEWLRGKIALIGALIPGEDEHRTPASAFGPPTFGVDIHARALSQMLQGRAVPVSNQFPLLLSAAAGMAIAGVIVGSAWTGAWLVALGLTAAIGYAAACLTVYATTSSLAPIVPPLFAFATGGALARLWRGFAERRDRRALRALFSRFVGAPVVEQIMRDRDLFMSGGRPRPLELTATVLFADVAGFTGICESLAPEPLIAWLDTYLETMCALIIAQRGVVLRFVGDGILAAFGVPVPRKTDDQVTVDARDAARAAVAMEAAMNRLNDAWAADGLPVGGLRIGLHTGPVVAGSLGRGERIEFCLLGDTANVGARLEQLGKQFAANSRRYCTIVAGEPTWQRLGGEFAGRRIGDIPLRGRQAAMGAYRIDSSATARSPTAPSGQRDPIP